MKKIYLFLLLSFLTITSSFGQIEPISETLHVNNVKAVINSNGSLFWDFENGQFIPPFDMNQSPTSTIRAAGLWLAGLNAGNLQGAIQKYNEADKTDFIPGMLDQDLNPVPINKIWRVSREDIDQHLADFADNGIIDNPNPNVFAWPAYDNFHFADYNDGLELPHTTHGYAPFWDQDGDDFYDPTQGDFPILDVWGCHAPVYPSEMLWFSYHDKTPHTESSMPPLNIEVHCLVFAFDCEAGGVLDNTIFSKFKLIHKNTSDVDSLYFGVYTDFDIGNPEDDFFGSDPNNSLLYAYNGDEIDEGGFENQSPVMAVDFLRGPFSGVETELAVKHIVPVTEEELSNQSYYNLLSGTKVDGSPQPNEGIYYPDNPNDANGWSETTDGNSPGNRKVLASYGPLHHPSIGYTNEILAAYTYYDEPGNTPLQNIETMYTQSGIIQAIYDNCFTIENQDCNSISTKAPYTTTEFNIQVFPNPTMGHLNIIASEEIINKVILYDVNGRLIFEEKWEMLQEEVQLSFSQLPKGIYFLEAQLEDGNSVREKIAVQ